MGIRKHLKATLGLLAMGGVAFGGAAHAAEGYNVLKVEQHAEKANVQAPDDYKNVTISETSETGNGKALQINTTGDEEHKNVAYVKQSAPNDNKVTQADLNLVQVGGKNTVGSSDDFINQVAPTSNKAELTIIQAKAVSGDNVTDTDIAVSNNSIVKDEKMSQALLEAKAGDNTVTFKQQSNGNNIYVGNVVAATSLNLDVTQKGGDTNDTNNKIYFTDMETTSGKIDLTLTQDGTKNTMNFGSKLDDNGNELYTSGDTASSTVKLGSISGSVSQSGDGNAFELYNVKGAGSLTLQGYDGTSALSQDGGDTLKLHNTTINSSLELDVTQSSEDNTINIGVVDGEPTSSADVTFNGTVTLKANQSGASTITVNDSTIGHDGNSSNIDIDQSGASDLTIKGSKLGDEGGITLLDINQSDGSEVKVLDSSIHTISGDNGMKITAKNTVEFESTTIKTAKDVTFTQNTTGSNDSEQIRFKNADITTMQAFSIDQTNKAWVFFGLDSTGNTTGSVNIGTLTGSITQSGAKEGQNIVDFDNVSVAGTADITITQSSSDTDVDKDSEASGNTIIFGSGTLLSAGSLTAKVDQEGEGNRLEIKQGSVGSLKIKGYTDDDDTMTMNGGNNDITISQLDSTSDSTLAMTIKGNGNILHGQFTNYDSSNTADANDIKLYIDGSGNTFYGVDSSDAFNVTQSITQDLVMKAGGTNSFDANIVGSYNHIGLDMEAKKDNTFDLDIDGSSNELGIYQVSTAGSNTLKANIEGSYNNISVYQNGSQSNYADIRIASDHNSIYVYQDATNSASVKVYQY